MNILRIKEKKITTILYVTVAIALLNGLYDFGIDFIIGFNEGFNSNGSSTEMFLSK